MIKVKNSLIITEMMRKLYRYIVLKDEIIRGSTWSENIIEDINKS